MKIPFQLFFSLTLISVFFSCSDYKKVLKSEDYTRKTELADEYFNSGKYYQSIVLYEQIYQRYPKNEIGELAYFRLGKCYYNTEDYYMGNYFLGQFTVRFPFSKRVEEATFLSAMCSVKQSPKSSLDQTETKVAINNLQQFIDRFPKSQLIDSCNQIMDRLLYKLELKEFDAVKLYDKTMNYRAAETSADIFLTNYPLSQFKEDASYILVNNSYLLTKNSIQSKKLERTNKTLERYRIFVAQFPNSKYLKSIKHIEKEMNELLIKLENQALEEL